MPQAHNAALKNTTNTAPAADDAAPAPTTAAAKLAAAARAGPTVSRSAIMPCARARPRAAAAPGEAAAPIAEVESEARSGSGADERDARGVGKAPIVPGLLVTTFAGSTDEDIAEACEKMRAPKGQRWDVTAKIKARDEKLGALRSLLSRVAEQRKAFGTLVSQIEVKLLATAAEERDKADKADKALVAGAASATGSAHRVSATRPRGAKLLEVKLAATARDAAEAAAAEGKAEAAELESLGAARSSARQRGFSGVADEADQRRFSELEVARHDEQDKVSAAVAACDANVASAARRGGAPRTSASVASHADALQALRSELAASEAERDRLGEASARADGGAAETRGAATPRPPRDLGASSTRRDGRGRGGGPRRRPRGQRRGARRLRADRRADAATEDLAARETELASLRAELDEKNEIDAKAQALALSEARGEVEALRRRLAAAEEAAAPRRRATRREMEEKLRDADVTRRKLHNTIQELRGNIRVFARVRPFLPSDGAADAPPVVVDMADGTSLTLAAEDDDADGEPFGDKKRKRRKELFSYDHVFGPSTGQERVFTEVAEFVQSALDGYQVCLFSYGQTGSGKTHTMQGTGTGPMRGIIPRAMEQVAAYCDAQRARGWAYEMEVSYVEIYNEQAMVDDLMQCAATHRCVAATDMNAVSSRSPRLHAPPHGHAEKKARLKGALNLVDLAGSERLDRSGAVGQRAKEAAHINKSLSALAGVFSALNRKQTHVPYRDSKLTFLLQPALSGDGKTLLFVNLSPTPGSANESLCSLRFAKQVQSVELGKAKRHIETVH
ncbi:hypothetical protein JL721_8135 [Aureococcus anophagefferens]|nr:hypothetical protein JL721_8135 [Aureococcus anophagefferens]